MASSVKHGHRVIENFNIKVTEYYETKHQFEQDILNKLENRRLRGNEITSEERKAIKMGRCTKCGSPGMTFTTSKTELRIECNSDSKCVANQIIIKPVFENIETLMTEARKNVDTVKEEIIHLKLNLLFGYASSDETRDAFTKLQLHMEKVFKQYDNLRMRYYGIIYNNDRISQLQDIESAISETVTQIKTNLSPTGSSGVTDEVVRDVVKIYHKQLMGFLLQSQEKLKYASSEVTHDEDYGDKIWRKRVNRSHTTLNDLIISL